jgi:hypothetical protein
MIPDGPITQIVLGIIAAVIVIASPWWQREWRGLVEDWRRYREGRQ